MDAFRLSYTLGQKGTFLNLDPVISKLLISPFPAQFTPDVKIHSIGKR
jgi:hypothetical protein